MQSAPSKSNERMTQHDYGPPKTIAHQNPPRSQTNRTSPRRGAGEADEQYPQNLTTDGSRDQVSGHAGSRRSIWHHGTREALSRDPATDDANPESQSTQPFDSRTTPASAASFFWQASDSRKETPISLCTHRLGDPAIPFRPLLSNGRDEAEVIIGSDQWSWTVARGRYGLSAFIRRQTRRMKRVDS